MKNWMIVLAFVFCLAAVPASAQDCWQNQCRPTPVRNAVVATVRIAATPLRVTKRAICCVKARRDAGCGIGQRAFACLRARRGCY